MNTVSTPNTPTLKLLGDYRTIQIISALQKKPLRYSEIQRLVPNCNVATLTNRLKRLETSTFIRRQEVSRTSVVYSLDTLGITVLPIINALLEFSVAADHERHRAATGGAAMPIQAYHDARRRNGYKVY